jgi:quinol monooxygenase YgiN
MPSRSSKHAVNVLIKIVVKKYKTEEFIECMHLYQAKILRQTGCLSYDLYKDLDEENTYLLVGEWKTAQAMEKHFQTHEYELILGAAKVLGDTFEMETTEVLHIGNHNWAREQIRSRKNAG